MSRTWIAVGLAAAAAGAPLLAAAVAWDWYLDGPQLVLALVAGYAAGTWLPRAVGGAVSVVLVAALVLANQWAGAPYHWLDDLVFFLVIVVGPAAAGLAMTTRARQVRRLERLREELAEQQRIDVAAARLDEQSRVEQRVHSRLAERIAGIAIRAEGAQRSGDADAFAEIEAEARGVLDQLRAALGSLAPEADTVTVPPVPDDPPPATTSLLDVAVALALGVTLAIETAVVSHATGPAWANVAGSLVVAAPLVVRRSRPLLSVVTWFVAALAFSAWLTPIPHTVTGVAFLSVVFYSLGAWCRSWRWVLTWLLAAAGSLALELLAESPAVGDEGDSGWIVLVWMVAATALGRITAGWQERVRRTEQVVAELERGRGAAVRLAMAQERQGLASELHDSVAHAMTVVCLQAGAQRRGPGDRGSALDVIATTATTSLAELKDRLDTLEVSERPLDRSRITEIGRRLGVELDVRAPAAAPIGPAATLAFRVIREAVVNVARHTHPASASVRVDRSDHELMVQVVDPGGEPSASAVTGAGRGLSGLSDAVTTAGGSMTWGPRTGGGFVVTARIPEAIS